MTYIAKFATAMIEATSGLFFSIMSDHPDNKGSGPFFTSYAIECLSLEAMIQEEQS